MRQWCFIILCVSLIVAVVVSWLVWVCFEIASQDLRFAMSCIPILLWAGISILFWRFFLQNGRWNDLQALDQKKQAILAFLAASGLKKSRCGLYSLPFFLVVGPPGSGKSNLLERAAKQLDGPVTIGDTHWWVGHDAVFIEMTLGGISGSNPKDVFELLRTIRPRLPVNATLLVLNPTDFILPNQTEKGAIARAIASGLHELDERTKLRVPIYLFLSKTDLVPGFREFFDHYETQERSQPWGFALSYQDEMKTKPHMSREEEIDRGFLGIVAAIRLRHIEWLTREVDPVRCAHLQGFAAQIATLQKTIAPILDALLSTQRWMSKDRFLRGVFLTSARQETMSIDAFIPELSRRFAMSWSSTLTPNLQLNESKQDYFISGTLEKAVLPEAGLVLRRKRYTPYWFAHLGTLTLIVLTCITTGYFLVTAFDREMSVVAHISATVSAISPIANLENQSDLLSLIQELKQLETMKAKIIPLQEPTFYATGLSSWKPLVEVIANAQSALRMKVLIPHLSALLEEDLVNTDADVETIKGNIALASNPSNIDTPELQHWLKTNAMRIMPHEVELFVSEGLSAIRKVGGLTVGQNYISTAHRLVAYKESRL